MRQLVAPARGRTCEAAIPCSAHPGPGGAFHGLEAGQAGAARIAAAGTAGVFVDRVVMTVRKAMKGYLAAARPRYRCQIFRRSVDRAMAP